jgi:hypothetical protein
MTYTIWHAGVLIGDSDFDQGNPERPGHVAGVFRPTSHGREIFPLLTGIMTASADLKDELASRGLTEDDMSADEVENILDNTPAGRKVIDIGRNLSEIELRDPTGKLLEFKTIAFIDTSELARLMERLDCGSDEQYEAVRDERAPELIVSATLRNRHRKVTRQIWEGSPRRN